MSNRDLMKAAVENFWAATTGEPVVNPRSKLIEDGLTPDEALNVLNLAFDEVFRVACKDCVSQDVIAKKRLTDITSAKHEYAKEKYGEDQAHHLLTLDECLDLVDEEDLYVVVALGFLMKDYEVDFDHSETPNFDGIFDIYGKYILNA